MKTTLRLIIILLLASTSLALGRSIYGQASKFKEIYQAESKVSQLTKEQEDLKATFEEKKRPGFLEKQARDKLGFQKPGETLYVVLNQEAAGEGQDRTTKENWEAWIDLLFR